MRIINCTVNQEYVVGAGVVVGASGSHDSTALRLTFGEEWDELSIYVSWKDSLGEQTAFSLITNDLKDEEGAYIVPIPAEPLRHEGSMMMTLVGYTLEDGIETSAKVSAVAYFRVLQSEYEPLEDGSITVTIAQELQSALDGKVDIETGKGLSANDLTDERLSELLANTSARHRHYNKAILDAITVPGVEINDAVMKKHTHPNKDLIDSYTQSNSDLADAVDKKHEHSNYEILESITDEKASMWDKAEILEDRYAIVDYLGNDTTTIPSSIAVVRALEESESASMKATDYDTTGTGNKVDTALNSEKLNGKTEQEIIAAHNNNSTAHATLVASHNADTNAHNVIINNHNADDDAHADLFETKQDKLVAGANITITGNIISAAGGSGGGSTVTVLDNPDGGIDLVVDGTLKTITKESDFTNHLTDNDAHSDILTPLKGRVSTIEAKESGWDAKSDFSGSYEDLTDKPNIPAVVSDLTNDAGYITQSAVDTHNTSLDAHTSLFSGKADKSDLDAKVDVDGQYYNTGLAWGQANTITAMNTYVGTVKGGYANMPNAMIMSFRYTDVAYATYIWMKQNDVSALIIETQNKDNKYHRVYKYDSNTQATTLVSQFINITFVNRGTPLSDADTNYTTYMARGEALFNTDTNANANGKIAWKYE